MAKNKYAQHLLRTGQVAVPTPECDDMEHELNRAKDRPDYRSAHCTEIGGYVYWISDEHKPPLTPTSDGRRFYGQARASAFLR